MKDDKKPWVDGLTFSEVLNHTANSYGQRDALVFPQLSYRRSYAGFLAEVNQVARALIAAGIQPGEHVGIWATNWPEWVLLQFATASVGSTLVNINPAYRSHELEYVLNQADVTTLFLSDFFKSSNYLELLEAVCPEIKQSPPGRLHSSRCPNLKRVIIIKNQERPGMLSWAAFLALGNAVLEPALHERTKNVRADDVVNIQFTSGTTGFPKGAQLTHRNLLMNAFYIGQRLRFTEQDRLCIPVPLYHCFGCVAGTLVCAISGGAMVFPAESFDPEPTLQAIQDEHCTAIYGVPTMFIAELSLPSFRQFNLSSLRTGVMAGSPCPIEVMRRVVDLMGAHEMTIAYGQTESSPVITQTETTDPLEDRVTTVGKVLPGIEVKIVEPGTTQEVDAGAQGELIARGHCVMKGYYKKPEETAAAITQEGWLRTGDLANRTAAGYFTITGRIKDMVIRGGENVYPREIEEFLYTHPKISDAQIVGVPDPTYGEELCAWIQLKQGETLTEDELKAFCRSQLAHFKLPRHVFFIDEYPKTVTGKIQKFKLRQMSLERLALPPQP